MMSNELFSSLKDMIVSELENLRSIAEKQGDVGRVHRCKGFLDWLNCDEGKKTLRRIQERCSNDPAIVQGVKVVTDTIRKKDVETEAGWDTMCSWLEEVLFHIYALEDIDTLLNRSPA